MRNSEKHKILKTIPGVDILLNHKRMSQLIEKSGKELVTYAIRQVVRCAREELKKRGSACDERRLLAETEDLVERISGKTLKPVINATGIVIHTNLGRVPLGNNTLTEISDIITGYSNLEFDLRIGQRGERNDLLSPLINYLTNAEDSLFVNNNAAAIMFALNVFANRKEVIISRGELIEIGGSFRIPDILKASGAKMVEVGTTNKTRFSDYQNAIGSKTAIIFKAHKSNFTMKGFTEEVSVRELASLAHKNDLTFIYDIGSGLLRKPKGMSLGNELDVRSAINDGADLVTFSGDKLLGGPQAGIISGKKNFVSTLRRAPMMRALRVGKLTIAALLSSCRQYLNDGSLKDSSPLFSMLERSTKDLKGSAAALVRELKIKGVTSEIVDSMGQCGGGTLPETKIKSYAVVLTFNEEKKSERVARAEKVFASLLHLERPIVGILRKGEIVFDVLTLFKENFSQMASSIAHCVLNKGIK